MFSVSALIVTAGRQSLGPQSHELPKIILIMHKPKNNLVVIKKIYKCTVMNDSSEFNSVI